MLWGAIVGDIVGSVYEFDNIKTKDFPLFSPHGFITDDTCMTIAVADGYRYPIELKYKTNRIDSDAEYEGTGIPIKDILKSQSAEDEGTYDCWKDISRIEKLIDNGFAHSGVFICIANDKYYWNGNCGENTLAYAFRINSGHKWAGEYNWNLSTSKNPEKVLAERPNLYIKNDYEFAWQDFYEMPAPNGLFKYLLVEIPGKA